MNSLEETDPNRPLIKLLLKLNAPVIYPVVPECKISISFVQFSITIPLATIVGDAPPISVAIALSHPFKFVDNNLNYATQYYYFVFATNSACIGGPLYLTTKFGMIKWPSLSARTIN